MNSEKLKKLTKVIKDILLKYKETREDDMLLYWYYATESIDIGDHEEYNLNDYYFTTIFVNSEFRKQLGIAPYSSVERARRKIQAKYPELQSEEIKKIRALEEQEYLEFAKSEDI